MANFERCFETEEYFKQEIEEREDMELALTLPQLIEECEAEINMCLLRAHRSDDVVEQEDCYAWLYEAEQRLAALSAVPFIPENYGIIAGIIRDLK